MNRPTVFQVGGVLYWVIQTRNPDTSVLKDADSTPAVAVRKNGASVADSVTVTKRSATTGIYDCSYNPAAEVEGDSFTFEESAAVTGTTTSSATYTLTWNARVVAVERGTDGALKPKTAGRDIEVAATTGAVVLDPATQTQIDDIQDAVESLGTVASGIVERSLSDTRDITFSWPVSGATITATKSINNGSYAAAEGAIAFLRTESSKHYYTLAYDADDRPTTEGQVRYKFVDGTYTRYVVLRVVVSGLDETIQSQLDDIQTDSAASVGYLTSLTTAVAAIAAIFTGMTSLPNWLRRAFRKDAGTAGMVTAQSEINTGGTGTFLGTTDSQEAISDYQTENIDVSATTMLSTTIATATSQTVLVLTEGSPDNDSYNNQLVVITDSATATQKARVIVSDYVGESKTLTLASTPVFTIAAGDSISIIAVGSIMSGSAVSLTLGATIPLELGEVTGLEEPLVIGDDYTEDVGRRIPVTLTDANGDAVAVEYGAHLLSADCTIKALFQPEGRSTTKAAITGTCTFVAASGATPAYLWLSLPRAETSKASPGTYQMQVEARWTDGFNVTLAHSGTAKFTRDIQRVS